MMKKAYILITLLVLHSIVFSQTEFSQSGTKWIVDYHWENFGGDYHIDYKYQYSLGEDTTLTDKIWKKLYFNEQSIGAILEEEKKVWYHSFQKDNSQLPFSILLYDFSLETNDSFISEGIPYIDNDISNIYWSKEEPFEIKVIDVKYSSGKKIIYLSNGNCWIEGIGSPASFLGEFRLIPLDMTSSHISLYQVILSDENTVYRNGEIIDPNHISTFLEEGKTWYIVNKSNPKEYSKRLRVGTPEILNYYKKYPIFRSETDGTQEKSAGYLFDVNGSIYWDYEGYYDIFLYNFNLKEGDNIMLYHKYWYLPPVGHYAPITENYTIKKVEYVDIFGKVRKKIYLEGSKPYIWIEDIGSTSGLLYPIGEGKIPDQPQNTLTCCYQDNEILYHDNNFKECYPTSNNEYLSADINYIITDRKLIINDHIGYTLNIYNTTGRIIHSILIKNNKEDINLSEFQKQLLFIKLEKATKSAKVFKILE